MPKMLNMPKIGVNMTEALIVEWLVKEGDSIKEGDHILDAETDKAVQEIYSTMTGVIGKILTPNGETVACQSPMAVILEPGEKLGAAIGGKAGTVPADAQKAKAGGGVKAPPVAVPADVRGQVPARGVTRLRISPLAKRTAKDMGIDWKALSPAKAGARVVRADVLAFVSTRGAGPAVASAMSGAPARVIPYAGIRRIIGERLGESARTIPSVALTLHAEVGKLTAWREGLKENDLQVGYTEMMVMIVARALREHPIMNSKLVGDEIHLVGEINVGVAVDTDRGLMVPVIRDVGCKGLREISEEYRRKVQAAKSGRAGADDLTGGTFTLTNLGMFGIEGFVPIINLPECCILGLGAIRRESVVREDDSVDIVSRMRMTLVFDHRIVDGAPAARFLQRIKHLVEWPMELLS